jgi:hypothetical protein
MATDFFDDDLVRQREAALKIKLDDNAAPRRAMATFRPRATCRTGRSPT